MENIKKYKKYKQIIWNKKVLGSMVVVGALVGAGVFGLNGYFGGGEQGVPEDTMTRGLVAAYNFDEGSGDTLYNAAATGSVNDGTLMNNPSWTTGAPDGDSSSGGLDFDGTDDYVDTGATFQTTFRDSFTIEAWVKPTDGQPAVNEIFIGSANNGSQDIYQSYITTGGLLYIHYESNNFEAKAQTTSAVFTNGQQDWAHIVGIIDKTVGSYGQIYIYVDGVLQTLDGTDDGDLGTNSVVMGDWTSVDELFIGARDADGSADYYFTGSIDGVKIYNRALSAEEVRYHYNRGGPVAHWKFDEGTGSTAYDSTDNSNDGTLHLGSLGNTATSSAWVSGKHSSAIDFDGEDDYINCGSDSSLNITDAITISAWVKFRDYDTNSIVTKQVGGDYAKQYLLFWHSSTNRKFRLYKDGTIHDANINYNPPLNEWFHIAAVYDGEKAYVLINGVLRSNEVSVAAPIDGGVGDAVIGCLTSTEYNFNGAIDDVKIYDYARTADEIRLDYNAGLAAHFGGSNQSSVINEQCSADPASCMELGLVGNWNFDQGTGDTLYDSSKESNNGTLMNNPTWSSGIEPLTGGKEGGKSLEFDGTDDYVDCGTTGLPVGAAHRTLEVWINLNILKTWNDIVGWGNKSANADFIIRIGDNGRLQINGWNNDWSTAAGAVNADEWTHIVATYFGGTDFKVYINSELKSWAISGAAFNTQNTYCKIGDFYSGTNFTAGSIDGVKIYNRALSAEEVRYHYNRGGPVGHWKLDEGTGSTAYDSTGNNNDGTLHLGSLGNTATSSAWVTGKHSSAIDFDGEDDYVNCGNDSSLNITDAITIEAWVKLDDLTGIDYMVNKWKTSGGGQRTYNLRKVDDKFYFGISGDGSNNLFNISSGSISTNIWYYVAGTYNRQNAYLYVNGVEVNSDTNISAIFVGNGDVLIGNYDGGALHFNGKIDDVKIYDYARTPAQIQMGYNAGLAAHFGGGNRVSTGNSVSDCSTDPASCMELGLVGNWNFDQGTGDTLYDSSKESNNGTLMNNPTWSSGIEPLTGGKEGGKSLDFDGTDDYVDCGNDSSLDITDAITIEAWVKSTQMGSTVYILGNGQFPSKGYQLLLRSTKMIQYRTMDGTEQSTDSYSDIEANIYYHIVAVRSGANATIFINGIDRTKTHGTHSDPGSSNEIFTIGSGGVNLSPYFNGSIDGVKIYNRALSAEEVRYHYNRGGPVAHWRMDEGEGSVVYNANNQLSLISDNLNGTLDLGSLGNTATSSAWVSGKHGSAIDFDGEDDYVIVLHDASLDFGTKDFSLGVWFKTTGSGTLLNSYSQGTTDQYLQLRISASKVFISYRDSPIPETYIWSNDIVADGKWHHFVAVRRIDKIYTYLDGEQQDDVGDIYANSCFDSYHHWSIGRQILGSARQFDGTIDDVRIYNYARTSLQILQDYNNGFAAHLK